MAQIHQLNFKTGERLNCVYELLPGMTEFQSVIVIKDYDNNFAKHNFAEYLLMPGFNYMSYAMYNSKHWYKSGKIKEVLI